MQPISIIGIGSPIGDDQAGWLVIDELPKYLLLRPLKREITLKKLNRPQLSLLADINKTDALILVDAVVSETMPIGAFQLFGWQDFITKKPFVSSHGVGVIEALALSEALGQLPPQVFLYGIEIDPANGLTKISAPVLQAIGPLADKIASQVYDTLGHA